MKLEIKVLNSVRLIKLLIAASRWISKHADMLNDLNVYPVPDGDTGTNMSMTLQAVENELIKLNHEPDLKELSLIVSQSILTGARGNSGIILAQLIQSLFETIEDKDEIKVDDIIKAFKNAKENSYKAVKEPIEGTMLTVISKVSEGADNYQGPKDDFILFLVHLKKLAHEAVEETPNQLKFLKEAGVVDAGGKGIFYILEGFEKSITDPEMLKDLERIIQSQAHRKEKLEAIILNEVYKKIDFKYCVEFTLKTQNDESDMEYLKEELSKNGDLDTIICAKMSRIIKIHIHTNHPGTILEIAIKYGDLNNIKIENLEYLNQNDEKKLEFDIIKENSYKNDKKCIINNKNDDPISYVTIAHNDESAKLFLENGSSAILIKDSDEEITKEDLKKYLKKIKNDKLILLLTEEKIKENIENIAKELQKEITIVKTRNILESKFYLKNKFLTLDFIKKQCEYNCSIEIIKNKNREYVALVNNDEKFKELSIKNLIDKICSKYISNNTLGIVVDIGKNMSKEEEEGLLKIKEKTKYKEVKSMQGNFVYSIYIENKDTTLSDIAIVTDSTSDLDLSIINELGITVIPLKIKIDDSDYFKDGIDITKEEFWIKNSSGEIESKTFQPSPDEFKIIYEKLLGRGYKKIISIHVSGKLSGTQQAAKVAKGMLKDNSEDIIVIDSKSVSSGLGYQVIGASKRIKSGESLNEILNWLECIQNKIKVYFVVDDINHLIKGGRINKTAAAVGSFLNLKPILKIENGEIIVEGNALGQTRAMKTISKFIDLEAEKGPIDLEIAWGGNEVEKEAIIKLREEIENKNNINIGREYEIGAAIGTHTGPVYGVAIISKS